MFYIILFIILLSEINNNNLLEFKRGDLLLLADGLTGQSLIKNRFVKAENTNNCSQGDIPVNLVHILPILTKPNVEIMVSIIVINCMICHD